MKDYRLLTARAGRSRETQCMIGAAIIRRVISAGARLTKEQTRVDRAVREDNRSFLTDSISVSQGFITASPWSVKQLPAFVQLK